MASEINRFIALDYAPHLGEMLLKELDRPVGPSLSGITRFEFNCYNVIIDHASSTVSLEEIVTPGENGEETLDFVSFRVALQNAARNWVEPR